MTFLIKRLNVVWLWLRVYTVFALFFELKNRISPVAEATFKLQNRLLASPNITAGVVQNPGDTQIVLLKSK
jgi:hypothetical protein